jgi:hypothetical protein
MTPTKKPKKTGAFPGQRNGTPSRRAATLANVTIAEAANQLDASDSQPEAEAPMPQTASAFASEPFTITQPVYTTMSIGLDPGPALGGASRTGYGGSHYSQQMGHGEI